MGSLPGGDAWADVDDLEGDAHYRALDLPRTCVPCDVTSAYRRLARVHHPDKGGDPDAFARIKRAHDVLSDPGQRAAYDAWQSRVEFRYVRGVAPRHAGGEDLMLDEFERRMSLAEGGSSIDPSSQLVLTCEVCGRPATTSCWTCGMRICEFCTLKRHWKGSVGLHWPLINKPGHMLAQLGKKQMEQKRIEDADRARREDPNHRSDAQLTDVREFKDAAYDLLGGGGAGKGLEAYDLRLAKLVMWCQTARFVHVAVHVPTGYADVSMHFECTAGGRLLLQPDKSPPVIQRTLDGRIAVDAPIQTRRAQDNRCAPTPPSPPSPSLPLYRSFPPFERAPAFTKQARLTSFLPIAWDAYGWLVGASGCAAAGPS